MNPSRDWFAAERNNFHARTGVDRNPRPPAPDDALSAIVPFLLSAVFLGLLLAIALGWAT